MNDLRCQCGQSLSADEQPAVGPVRCPRCRAVASPPPSPPRTLDYGREAEDPRSVKSVMLAMFRLGNVVVLLTVVVPQLLALVPVALALIRSGRRSGGIIMGLLALSTVWGHFANIVEEIGYHEREELPTLLRGLDWGEDVFRPACRFAGSLLFCYGASLYQLLRWDDSVAAAALALLGTVLFPAVFLTAATSGSLWNLRPDRVLRVMLHCGRDYLVSTLLWILAGSTYLVGLVGTVRVAVAIFRGSIGLPAFAGLLFGLLLAGIYFMHVFCWHLGLLYRGHHGSFPWVLQCHIPTPRPPKAERAPDETQDPA